jgi:hypothetical protein
MRLYRIILIISFLLMTQSIGNDVYAQNPMDPLDVIRLYLPEGVAIEKASEEELSQAVKQAVTVDSRFDEIVKAAVKAVPDMTEVIVLAAVSVLPAQNIVICHAAGEVAPEQTYDIEVCKKAAEASLKFDSLPPTKPQREEPSPVKPID